MEKHQKPSLVLAIISVLIVTDLYLPVSFSADEVKNIVYFIAIITVSYGTKRQALNGWRGLTRIQTGTRQKDGLRT